MPMPSPPLVSTHALFEARYEILDLIGQGGFGQVYKARQLTTEQEVAIKILRPLGGDERQHEKQLARFRREMRICSRLFHPNIVRPIDSGQTEDGLLYSVFEFVPGQNLGQVLEREGVLEPREAIRLMMQLLDALDCAHQRGVVHRDIKPQNIMISDTGARRNALVLDFGLSTLTDEVRTEVDSGISSISEILGTPSYSAPEQLRGQQPDMRSDLYAWGLVFLECLTGELVIQGRSLQEVIRKQIGPEPVTIPEVLEGLRVGELLRQVTEKDVDKRNVSAGVLLRELEVCAHEEGRILARRLALGRARPARAVRRRPRSSSLLGEGQLRQITALCCGMTVSTTHPGSLDVEEQDSLLRARQDRCIALAEKLGGYPGGVLGRQVMFYFGYPTAREDAPRSAARTALRLLEETSSWNAEPRAKDGLRVDLRIGIHSGPAVIRDARAEERQDFPGVLGTTSTIASQYQEMAELGEALVSPDTWRLLRNDFVFETVRRTEPHTLRRVEVSRLGHVRAADLSRPEPPMVGRAQELELALQRWSLVRQGVGQAVLLTGEPGIGKSRFVRELCRELRGTPHTLIECRCALEDRTSVLRPFIELLEHLLGYEPDWPPSRALDALEALLSRYGFELDEAVPLFASLLSLPLEGRYAPLQVLPDWQRGLTFDAVLNLLVEMAAQQPVLLVVEDLHWADPTTLELLTFLLDAVSTARLGVILTARSDFIPLWPPAHLFQLRLGRLERSRVEEMISGLTGGQALPAEVAEQVVSRTDGVPLFVEELTRMVLESGARSRLPVPSTLRGLLEARLDRLGPAKETAELAALLGREFSFELLRAISPRGERALQAELSALVAAELLQLRRRLRDSTYVFKHSLIQEAAYDSLPRSTRRELHARIASVLEERFPAIVESRPEMLAHHYAAADQKVKALGYAQRAAMNALLRSANAEAISQATQALQWLELLPAQGRQRMERELELLAILVPALMASRGWSDVEVRSRTQRALELLDRLGDNPHASHMLWSFFFHDYCRCEFETARPLLERLLALAEHTRDTGLQSLVLSFMGELSALSGRLSETRALEERALALVEPEQHRHMAHLYGVDPLVSAEATLGMALWFLGEPDQALAHTRAAIARARDIEHPISELTASLYLMNLHFLRDERDEVLAVARRGLDMATHQGLSLVGVYCRILLAWAKGEPERVERHLRELHESGMLLGISWYTALLVDAEATHGKLDSALRHVEDILQWTRQSGEVYWVPLLLELRAGVLRELGDREHAEASLREAREVARTQGARMLELRTTTALCQLLHERGEDTRARELLEPLLASFVESAQPPELRRALSLYQELTHGQDANLFH